MRGLRVWTAAACLAALAAASGAQAAPSDRYVVRNIVSSDTTKIAADRADPNLKNPWGLASSATSPWWPANAGLEHVDDHAGDQHPTPRARTCRAARRESWPDPARDHFLPLAGRPSSFIFNTLAGEIRGWRGGIPDNDACSGSRERASAPSTWASRSRRPRRHAAALCRRLRQQPHRHRQPAMAADQRTRGLRRPEPARRLRRVRCPDGWQPRSSSPTPRRPRPASVSALAPASASSTRSISTAPSSPASPARAAC